MTRSGGTASGGLVMSNAVEIVSNGGTQSATTSYPGGTSLSSRGGLATGVDLYGGTLEVASGGLVSGQLTFGQDSAGSTLVLDAGASLNVLVAGFGTFEPGYGVGVKPDKIDLQGISFGTTKKSQVSFTEAAGNLGGTLTVTDGVHTANIALIGQYTASEFALSNDGHGGTLITFEASSSTTTVTGGNGNGHGHG
jgi:hypothetical protein